MKFLIASLTLLAVATASTTGTEATACASGQVVVCKGNGNGGLITLGNVAPGLLGVACSGGDFYCCSQKDVQQIGLVNLNLNAQCSLNHVL
ncbi:hypothetical protein N7462_000691 [Penicillium macrosclerotiorum]|uniref:uncharacterized protein n=1 Tax=Penicillium macrosclerotiorum TaxID=303699 RepID=UPI002547E73B|nr:uncharacterized protein N7462_000691 [Penicillium macrosclerotiorum]KAJ5698686.1 hypothetical protein N7462_000691 [Penicillium macrosclerotiorum]